MKKVVCLLLAVLTVFAMSTPCFASAEGAVLIDAENGRVLFEHSSSKQLPMASTTKIMTALLALEETNLDEMFTVDSKAIMVEGSSMGLMKGDKVSLRVLAFGMLLASGNDAANAAAVRVSGSVPDFVELMNKRAKEIGMENTSFETPSGLDGENHYSTAYDMALLAREALKSPAFAEICGSSSVQLEYGNPPYLRWLSNHNRLLKTLDGATGVKTGFTKKSGRCLVSSAERDGVSLICVTLNCPDDWSYHTAVYNEYFAALEAVPLETLVNAVTVPVSGGVANAVSLAPSPVKAALKSGEYENIKVVLSTEPFLFAPVEKGAVAGHAYFYLDNVLIAETALVTKNPVAEKAPPKRSFWQKIKDFFETKEK